MAAPGTFVARLTATSLSSSTTLPVIQLTLNANRTYEIYRVEISNESSTTSGDAAYEIVASSAVAPGTLTAGNASIVALNYTDTIQATVQGSGFSGSLTGTQTVLKRQGFNILSSALYLPVPEERFVMQGNATNYKYLWVRLPVLPASTTMTVEVVGRET
jgi:hypothetical protein